MQVEDVVDAVMEQPKIIVSIPHSGTRFLMERLGVEHYTHVTKPWDVLLRSCDGRKLIAPVRDPLVVWRSWVKRWLPPRVHTAREVQFHRCWYVLHALTLVRDVEFVCLDRGPTVKGAGERIKDWHEVGHVENPDALDWHIDLGDVYDLPFVRRFYG